MVVHVRLRPNARMAMDGPHPLEGGGSRLAHKTGAREGPCDGPARGSSVRIAFYLSC